MSNLDLLFSFGVVVVGCLWVGSQREDSGPAVVDYLSKVAVAGAVLYLIVTLGRLL